MLEFNKESNIVNCPRNISEDNLDEWAELIREILALNPDIIGYTELSLVAEQLQYGPYQEWEPDADS